MPKIANVYYLMDSEVEGQRPDAIFIGAVFSSNKNPDDPRKVLNLSKYKGKDESGQAIVSKAVSIHFSDGSVEYIADHTLLIKFTEGEKKSQPIPSNDIPF